MMNKQGFSAKLGYSKAHISPRKVDVIAKYIAATAGQYEKTNYTTLRLS